jgi:hypothetical protein
MSEQLAPANPGIAPGGQQFRTAGTYSNSSVQNPGGVPHLTYIAPSIAAVSSRVSKRRLAMKSELNNVYRPHQSPKWR